MRRSGESPNWRRLPDGVSCVAVTEQKTPVVLEGLDAEGYRREALGAFSHEIRTPLTSLRMVMELAQRESRDGSLTIDDELAPMLHSSVDSLQALADDLQDFSRFERGRLLVTRGPASLRAAYAAAIELAGRRIAVAGAEPPDVDGPWDPKRLVRAFAGFLESANRAGDGSGEVVVSWTVDETTVSGRFASGLPTPSPRNLAADVGFSFFRSRAFVIAMGGSVEWERAEQYFAITLRLPL